MTASRHSLKTRFIVVLSALIGLSAVALMVIIGRQATVEVESRAVLQLTGQARHLAKTLDRSMWFWRGEVEMLRDILQQCGHEKAEVVRAVLNGMRRRTSAFSWMGLTDANGIVLAATDDILVGESMAARPMFYEARQGPFISDVHESVLLAGKLPNPSGKPMKLVNVSMPVRGPDGAFAGVLTARLNWNWAWELERFMRHDVTEEDTEFIVVGRDGTILLGSPEEEGTKLQFAVPTGGDGSLTGWRIQTWPNGVPYLTVWATGSGYNNYKGLGWTVLARQPLDVAYAPVRTLVGRILVAGIVFSLLFAAAAWFAAEKIIRPLRDLTDAADRLSRGEKAAIPRNQSISEIAVLSQSLSTLVDNLTRSEIAKDKMQDTATRDQLTGLLNRHGLARRVVEAVREPMALEGLVVSVGISVGHATWSHPAQKFETALNRADQALYQAKKTGKNRWCSAEAPGAKILCGRPGGGRGARPYSAWDSVSSGVQCPETTALRPPDLAA